MCCFAKPVKVVTDTNLFARLTGNGTQMLAYQMDYESDEQNAMILPIPVALPSAEDSLRFISLKSYGKFFDHLDRGFPAKSPPQPTSRSGWKAGAIAKNLAVHDVGDFVASFVPTIDDFDRLDQQFAIPKSSWDKIPHYTDYGFAVFQLKNLKGKPHPMAFEFKTRFSDQIFFPTVHIHDGEVHQREKFDHTLYLQNDQFDPHVRPYLNSHVIDKSTGFVRSKKIARTFMDLEKSAGLVDGNLLVHRVRMKGELDNKDVLTRVTIAEKAAGGLGMIKGVTPTLMACAGLGWIIQRRNEISDRSKR